MLVTVPGALRELYRRRNVECFETQNDTDQWTAYCRASGVLDAIKEEYGSASAGIVCHDVENDMIDRYGRPDALSESPDSESKSAASANSLD